MDERHGFIHEKLEIKILILFILARLPVAVPHDTLAELTLCDGGISFFEYAECLADLVRTGHVSESGNLYLITELGRKNGAVTEDNIPYSVRIKAEKATSEIKASLTRDWLISAEHSLQRRGGCTVELNMSDGVGELINLKLLAANEAQAIRIEKNFRENAERLYTDIVELLDKDEK
ncbi:MAG: DUF4364 family protein [Oscillospiraceae bacterium]|nr:DUF4364 family protein [Oscillospiraceae bacterium]